jgi:hypothetical protein
VRDDYELKERDIGKKMLRMIQILVCSILESNKENIFPQFHNQFSIVVMLIFLKSLYVS